MKYDNQPQSEYEALRDEILFLTKKAFDIWQWSLLSIFVVLGGILYKILDVNWEQLDMSTILGELIYSYPILLVIVFNTLAISVILALAIMIFDLEDTKNRLGAYLTLVYDKAIDSGNEKNKDYGWIFSFL